MLLSLIHIRCQLNWTLFTLIELTTVVVVHHYLDISFRRRSNHNEAAYRNEAVVLYTVNMSPSDGGCFEEAVGECASIFQYSHMALCSAIMSYKATFYIFKLRYNFK